MGKKLNRDALQSFLVRIPVILFSFLHSILLIRLLGTEGNGLYTYIMAGISLSLVVAGFDAKRSTIYHIVKEKFTTNKVLGLTLIVYALSIGIVIVFVTLTYLIRTEVSYFLIPEDYFILFYALFFIFSFTFQHLAELCKAILQSFKVFGDVNRYLFYANLFQVILYAAGYIYALNRPETLTYISIFSLVLAAQLGTLLYGIHLVRKEYNGSVDFKTASIRKSYIRYAGKGYLNILGHFFNKRLDIWFIEFYTGLKNLGIYAVASKLANFLLLATAPLVEVLRTYLITYDRREGNVIFTRYFKLVVFMIILLSSALYAFGPWAIKILFGDEFLSASKPLKILCLGLVFVNIKTIVQNYNRAYNDLYYNIWAQWAGVLSTILLDIVLIPRYGLLGAAWASVLASVLSSMILLSIFLFKQKVTIFDLLIPTMEDIKSFRT